MEGEEKISEYKQKDVEIWGTKRCSQHKIEEETKELGEAED